jgi:hypothetical protein
MVTPMVLTLQGWPDRVLRSLLGNGSAMTIFSSQVETLSPDVAYGNPSGRINPIPLEIDIIYLQVG